MHRTTAAERARLIEQYQRSGLSRRDFAQKHGFSIYTLHRWLARAGDEAATSQRQQFSEVKLLPSFSSTSWALEIASPTGVTVRFRDLPPIEELTRLLSGAAC